ncbi:MAG: DUF1232 domain-containing protein [candidate division WOR-3 bacterium]
MTENRKSIDGYLNFYKFLRHKISLDAEKKFGKYGKALTDLVLTAPDLFIFTFRLYRDPELPIEPKLALGAVLTYWVLPLDFLSEMFLGVLGYIDDVFLAAYILNFLMHRLSEDKINEYWPGSEKVPKIVSTILGYAELVANLMGKNIHVKFQKLMKRIEDKMSIKQSSDVKETPESEQFNTPQKVQPKDFSDFSIGLETDE